jgi:hypothetical protein
MQDSPFDDARRARKTASPTSKAAPRGAPQRSTNATRVPEREALVPRTDAGARGVAGIWGFVGSRYARFGSFALAPRALFRYLWALATGKGESHVGHNPATSWVALAMLVSVLGVAVTGAMAAMGVWSLRHVHALFAYGTALLAVLHVAGVALHALRRRDDLVLGMIDGRKAVPSQRGLRSTHPIVALVFLVLIGGAAVELVRSYDASRRTLALPGIAQVRLGSGAKKRALRALPPPRERD